MGNGLIFPYHQLGAERGRSRVDQPVIGFWFKHVGSFCRNKTQKRRRDVMTKTFGSQVIDPILPRKAADCVDELVTVPQTDSGGQVENTKALERTLVKELGKLTP